MCAPRRLRYGLKLNNAILAEAKHLPLYQELVEKYSVSYIAGGATQNTIRVAQWMHGEPGFSAYIGCIGHDEFGRHLKEAAESDGVTTHYQVTEERPTGTCAVLVHDRERSLVANLSAAERYSKSHWDSEAIQKVVSAARVFYSAGFFLTSSPESMLATARHAAEHNKVFAMNLSAPFLCQFFKEPMLAVLPYCDFVFGNESEAAAFAENNGFAGLSVEDIALRISAMPKANGARGRIVIITQGAKASVIAEGGRVRSIAVPKVAKELIVDTNGAGDSFVGGFLALLCKGASIDDCVHAGHFAAGHVITQEGCSFVKSLKYSGPGSGVSGGSAGAAVAGGAGGSGDGSAAAAAGGSATAGGGAGASA